MTKRQVGGYEFRNECSIIRNAATAISDALTKIIENNPGPATLAMLVTKMAVENLKIVNAVSIIEKIGKTGK